MSRPDHWRDFDAESRRAGGRLVLWSVAAVAVVLALVAGVWAIRVSTADVKGRGDQVLKTKGDADYRMAAYDHFYNLCASVQATEDRIGLAEQQVGTATTPDEKKQLESNVLALKGVRAQLVREYNADASKQATKGQFRAADLPYHLNVNQEHTTCAS